MLSDCHAQSRVPHDSGTVSGAETAQSLVPPDYHAQSLVPPDYHARPLVPHDSQAQPMSDLKCC